MDMKTGSRVLLTGSLVVALLGGTTGAALVLRRPVQAASGGDSAPTAVAQERDFTPRVLATGNVSLLPGARIAVGARVSGVVVSLPVTQGTRVARDAVIARLDDREARARLEQVNATIAELQATLTQQQQELERAEALARADGATAQELLAARTAFHGAQARLDGALAARALAQLQLEYTVIRAPIAGVVASVSTREGETVAASLAAPTFVTLLDPARIECIALVDETDIGRVHTGDNAEFTVDAWPGRTFHGVVVSIAPDATVVGGVVDYEVHIRVAGGTADLKPQNDRHRQHRRPRTARAGDSHRGGAPGGGRHVRVAPAERPGGARERAAGCAPERCLGSTLRPFARGHGADRPLSRRRLSRGPTLTRRYHPP